MKKKWTFAYIVALVLLPVILFIITRLELPSELMSPPGLYGENAKIQDAFESAISDSNNINLKYPSEGENNSAFVLYDIDGDNRDEAIVFYAYKDESTVRFNVLDYIEGEWTCVFDEDGYGSDILSIDFFDFDNDGLSEIICCWKLVDSTTSKTLTVHKVSMNDRHVEGLKPLVNQTNSFYSIEDFDCDGTKEILVSWLDSTNVKSPKAFATMLKLDTEGNFKTVGESVQLDASVATYSTLSIENIGEKPYVFIDTLNGENSMITEVIYWDAEKESLVLPFNDESSLITLTTQRSPAVASKDINDDGHLEIPIAVTSGDFPLLAWNSYDGKDLTVLQYFFANTTFDYYYVVDAEKKDSVMATFTKGTGALSIYNVENGEQGNLLFTITSSDEGKNLTITITDFGEAMGLTEESIEKNIVRG